MPEQVKKVWTRPEIEHMLKTRDAAVERAMVALFNRQTRDEQVAEDTKHLNGIGFSANCAHYGTYYAKWVLSGKKLSGEHLTRARRIALQHARQIVEEANR